MVLSIAHRGYYYKDNTSNAFLCAIENNFDMIELDLHKTADDILIIHHDPFIEKYFIEKTPFELLKKTDPLLLTLDEYFGLFPSEKYPLYIDIKGSDYTAFLLMKYIRQNNICKEHIIVASFNQNHLNYFCNIDIKVALITANSFLPNIYENIFENVDYLVIAWNIVCIDIINYCKKKNKKIFVYTCQSLTEYNYIIQYDVDGIISDINIKNDRCI